LKTVDYRIAEARDDTAKMYGVVSLPTTLLIDRDGRIKATHTGIVGKGTYENEIVQLLDNDKGGSR
jgi:hypothetical protein